MSENKIIVIGQSATGKTSIIQRCLNLGLEDETTIGVSFYRLLISPKSSDTFLNIWDTSGQERYSSLSKIYVRDALCAVIVFDVTDIESFRALNMWKRTVDDFDVPHCIIIANKIDKDKHQVTESDIKEWCDKNHVDTYILASSLNNQGIDRLITKLTQIANVIPNTTYGTLNNKSFRLNDTDNKMEYCRC